jgi:hypothetical protein
LPEGKHPVNVLFTKDEYVGLVRRATELTLEEGRRVSVAELVRRLTFTNSVEFRRGVEADGAEIGLTTG